MRRSTPSQRPRWQNWLVVAGLAVVAAAWVNLAVRTGGTDAGPTPTSAVARTVAVTVATTPEVPAAATAVAGVDPCDLGGEAAAGTG